MPMGMYFKVMYCRELHSKWSRLGN